MPLDSADMKGTEKNGMQSEEYCKFCYEKGAFINPGMNLEELKEIVRTQMKKMNAPEQVINMSLTMLPTLKRWKEKIPVHL